MNYHCCPVCTCTQFIEVNLHSDGFSTRPTEECGVCGSVWAYVKGQIKLMTNKTFETYKKEYTKYASTPDEFVAEDQKVWFS